MRTSLNHWAIIASILCQALLAACGGGGGSSASGGNAGGGGGGPPPAPATCLAGGAADCMTIGSRTVLEGSAGFKQGGEPNPTIEARQNNPDTASVFLNQQDGGGNEVEFLDIIYDLNNDAVTFFSYGAPPDVVVQCLGDTSTVTFSEADLPPVGEKVVAIYKVTAWDAPQAGCPAVPFRGEFRITLDP